MKITLLSEDRIRLDGHPGPMTIEAESPETTYSPFHMLGSSMATCTLSVLASWATHAKIPLDDLAIEVGWTFAEDPHRVGSMTVELDWPSLPASRHAAAKRVADLCTVKVTLKHPPEVVMEVRGAASSAAPSEAPEEARAG